MYLCKELLLYHAFVLVLTLASLPTIVPAIDHSYFLKLLLDSLRGLFLNLSLLVNSLNFGNTRIVPSLAHSCSQLITVQLEMLVLARLLLNFEFIFGRLAIMSTIVQVIQVLIII